MRWVLTTPLGSFVEPDVKRNLTIVSGFVSACAASTSGPGAAASSAEKGVAARSGRLPSVSTTSTCAGNAAAMALAKDASLANTSPGVTVPSTCLSLAWSDDISEYAGDTGV